MSLTCISLAPIPQSAYFSFFPEWSFLVSLLYCMHCTFQSVWMRSLFPKVMMKQQMRTNQKTKRRKRRKLKRVSLPLMCGKQIYTYANRLDPGQLTSDLEAGLRSNLFATQSSISHETSIISRFLAADDIWLKIYFLKITQHSMV